MESYNIQALIEIKRLIDKLKSTAKGNPSKLKMITHLESRFNTITPSKIIPSKLKVKPSPLIKRDEKSEKLNPKHVHHFLSAFNDRNKAGLKYLTHKYEDGSFIYKDRLSAAHKEYKILNTKYNLPKNLGGKIHGFINEKWNIYNREEELIGWGHIDLENWCKDHPGIHPLDGDNQKIKNMIARFKNNIKIRRDTLDIILEEIINRIFKTPEIKNKWEIKIDESCKKAVFFTDVDQLFTGIKIIIESSKNYSKSKKLNIRFEKGEEGEYLTRKIIVIFENEIIGNEPSDTLSGDSGTAMNHLEGLCDWKLIAPFKYNDKVHNHEIDVYTKKIKQIEKTPEGVIHQLIFYAQ